MLNASHLQASPWPASQGEESLEATLERAAEVISEALECGLLAEAETAIDQMEESAPEDPRPHHLRGVLAMLRGDAAAAADAFRRALRSPGAPAETRLGLATALLDLGTATEAWEVLAPLRIDPPEDARYRHWLIRAGAAAERWAELASLLELCLERTPADHATRFALAGVYLRLGRPADARREHRRLCDEHPELDGLEELARRLEEAGAAP